MPSLQTLRPINSVVTTPLVQSRLRAAGPGPVADALMTLVPAIHAAIVEHRPTSAEMLSVVEFLTDVGHACDERRQEWVLLFDLLGISTLVEEVNSRRPPRATPNTIKGPFYRKDAPKLPSGASISLDGKGETLLVRGHVADLDGRPVAGARVETWQPNSEGFFENQQPDLQPEFNLRGTFETDAGGDFHYRTVRPGGYSVPDDGPVGKLLGGIGCSLRRPANIQFQISARGFDTLTTHVFDANDPHLQEDAVFGARPELVAAIERAGAADRAEWKLEFTFVMARRPRERGA